MILYGNNCNYSLENVNGLDGDAAGEDDRQTHITDAFADGEDDEEDDDDEEEDDGRPKSTFTTSIPPPPVKLPMSNSVDLLP